MKQPAIHIVRISILLITLFVFRGSSSGQGRIVINEYMPWSNCNTTSEFIELMNFGPGPMNIGCYIVTNGQYAVTIPANTIIQPGEYYLISGQNTILQNCGNIDSTVTVDLNWNTCNCADKPIPTTGDGFMQNGGGANEKIVLLSPSMNVLDAVSRSSPVSSSVSITTSSNGGACTPSTFDLDNLAISYEVINTATGIDNSYSRRVDGDCGWVKTTDISANAPNKTGSTASATYNFSTLSASECNSATGSISIAVSAADVASLFPMTYTLAFDKDSNSVFNSNDIYTTGVDNSSPSIDIGNLAYGRYRITVGSSSGCNLQSFDFFIFNCYGVLLPYRVVSFNYNGIKQNKYSFKTNVEGIKNIKTVILEGKVRGTYSSLQEIHPAESITTNQEFTFSVPAGSAEIFRIKLITHSNTDYYSSELQLKGGTAGQLHAWPNPVVSHLNLNVPIPDTKITYSIINSIGKSVKTGNLANQQGNTIQIPLNDVPKGFYRIIVYSEMNDYRQTVSFIKE